MSFHKKLAGFIVIGGLFVFVGAGNILAAEQASVNTDILNFRKSPNTESEIILKLEHGAAVNVIGAQGEWLKVSQNSKTAYVTAQYVKFSKTDGLVKSENVNIRKSGSTSSEILGTVDSGTVLPVTAREGDFYVVDFKSNKAYVHKDFIMGNYLQYVSTINPASQPSQAAKPASAPAKKTTAPAKSADKLYVKVISSDGVNIRKEKSTESEVLTKLPEGAYANLVEIGKEWDKVSYGSTNGYVKAEFLEVKEGTIPKPAVEPQKAEVQPQKAATQTKAADNLYAAVITSDGVNVRKGKSTDSEVLSTMPAKSYADLVEIGNEWHKVTYEGKSGYVKVNYLEIKTGTMPKNTPAEAPKTDSDVASKLVAYAKRFVGVPYVYGAENLSRAVDCSGYTMRVFQHFGYNISRTSHLQVGDGKRISSKSNLKVADLVFFDTNGRNNGSISHVGIYIGGGRFIHASSGRADSVTISGLGDTYYSTRFVAGSRVLD